MGIEIEGGQMTSGKPSSGKASAKGSGVSMGGGTGGRSGGSMSGSMGGGRQGGGPPNQSQSPRQMSQKADPVKIWVAISLYNNL